MFKTEFSPKNIKQTSDKNKEKCKLGVISCHPIPEELYGRQLMGW